MTIVVQSAAWRMAQASRHPEVNQESTTRLEPDNQILAAALQGAHAFALELRSHGPRLERPHKACVLDLDTVEPPPDQLRFELEPNRLDLGQLGHQPIVSSTIGLAGGDSSPSS